MTDVNINTTGQAPMWGVGGSDAAQKSQKMKNHGITQDSIEIGTILRAAMEYIQDANKPSLPPPNLHSNNATPTPQKSPPTYQSLYQEKFASNLDQLANQYGLSKSQVGTMIFKHHNPEQPIDDTFLEGLLAKLESKVAGEMAEEYELPTQKEIVEQGKKHLKNLGETLDKTGKKFQEAANQLPAGDAKMNIAAFLKTLSNAKSKLKEAEKDIEESDQMTYAQTASAMREGALKEIEMLKAFIGKGAINLFTEKGESVDAQAVWDLASDFDLNGEKIRIEIEALEAFAMGGVVVGLDKISDTWFEFDIDSGELAPPKGASKTYNKQLTESYTETFETALEAFAQQKGLSAEQVAKIKFAHYNPGMGDPAVKGMVSTVEANALAVLGENFTLPKGFKPTIETEKYNYEISNTYSEAVEQALRDYGEQNGLTEPQVESMIYLHYNEGGDVPGSKELAPIVSKIETEVLGQIAEPNGLPANFKPEISTFSHDAQMNGDFSITFEENLRKEGLSSEEMATIRGVIDNPTLRNTASAKVIETIDKVWAQSVGDVQAKFGLPVGWAPVGGLETLSGDSFSRNTIIQATESINVFRTQIDSMPPSDGKVAYSDALKIVSDALSAVRKLIAKMKGLDTEVSQKTSQAKLETELKKIKDKAAKMKEIEEKMKKMEALKALGPFGDFLKAIFMILFAPIMALTLGPILAAALAGAMVADMAIKQMDDDDKGLFAKMFDAIAEAMPDTPMGRFASAMIQIMIVIAVVSNIMLAQKLLFEDSSALQELAMAAGATEEQADAFKMAMEMIVMVAEMIIGGVLTGGAASAASTTKIVAETALQTSKIAIQAATKTSKAAEMAAKVTKMLGKTVKSIAKAVAKVSDSVTKAGNASAKASRALEAATKLGQEATKKVQVLTKKVIELTEKAAKLADEAAGLATKASKVGGQVAQEALESSLKLADEAAEIAEIATQAATKATEIVSKATKTVNQAVKASADANKLLATTSPKLAKLQRLATSFVDKIGNVANGGINVQKIELAATIVQGGVEGLTSLVEIPKNVIQAEIAIDRGAMDAQDAEVAEMIKLMGKFLKILYQMLGSHGDWYQQVGNLQQKMWDDKSNVLSKLTQV